MVMSAELQNPSCFTPLFSQLNRADQVCSRTGDVKGEAITFWKWGQNTSVDRTEAFLPDPVPVSLSMIPLERLKKLK